MELKQKMGKLFGSLKFWLATTVFASAVLEGLINGTLTLQVFADIGQTWLMAVTAIGVADGVAERLGGSKRKSE